MRIGINGKTLEVRIPKGVREGQSIRLAGQGGTGGDLYLDIEYAAHPQFEVDGRNIIHVLPVAPWEAALGATAEVQTLEGPVRVRIPAGTSSGRRIRIKGKGFPSGSAEPGDLYAEVRIVVPESPTDTDREIYESLRDRSDFRPREENERRG